MGLRTMILVILTAILAISDAATLQNRNGHDRHVRKAGFGFFNPFGSIDDSERVPSRVKPGVELVKKVTYVDVDDEEEAAVVNKGTTKVTSIIDDDESAVLSGGITKVSSTIDSGASQINTRFPGFIQDLAGEFDIKAYFDGVAKGNGISVGQKGVIIKTDGGYLYKGDDGKIYIVKYITDENEYKNQGSHLQTAFSIPGEILKVVGEIAAKEATIGTDINPNAELPNIGIASGSSALEVSGIDKPEKELVKKVTYVNDNDDETAAVNGGAAKVTSTIESGVGKINVRFPGYIQEFANAFNINAYFDGVAKGIAVSIGPKYAVIKTDGGYLYKGDDGKIYMVKYITDENEYKTLESHLQTEYPIPEEVLKVIDQISAKETAVGSGTSPANVELPDVGVRSGSSSLDVSGDEKPETELVKKVTYVNVDDDDKSAIVNGGTTKVTSTIDSGTSQIKTPFPGYVQEFAGALDTKTYLDGVAKGNTISIGSKYAIIKTDGGYLYKGDDGKIYKVKYILDENEYKNQESNLQTQYPIPEEVLKVIDQISAKETAVGSGTSPANAELPEVGVRSGSSSLDVSGDEKPETELVKKVTYVNVDDDDKSTTVSGFPGYVQDLASALDIKTYFDGVAKGSGIPIGQKGVIIKTDGGYLYKGDDGSIYIVKYVTDENEYNNQGSHLLTHYPIPDEIVKVIQKIITNEGTVSGISQVDKDLPDIGTRSGSSSLEKSSDKDPETELVKKVTNVNVDDDDKSATVSGGITKVTSTIDSGTDQIKTRFPGFIQELGSQDDIKTYFDGVAKGSGISIGQKGVIIKTVGGYLYKSDYGRIYIVKHITDEKEYKNQVNLSQTSFVIPEEILKIITKIVDIEDAAGFDTNNANVNLTDYGVGSGLSSLEGSFDKRPESEIVEKITHVNVDDGDKNALVNGGITKITSTVDSGAGQINTQFPGFVQEFASEFDIKTYIDGVARGSGISIGEKYVIIKTDGGYLYKGDDERIYIVKYFKDEFEFKNQGSHFQTQQPIPYAILKVLEKIIAREATFDSSIRKTEVTVGSGSGQANVEFPNIEVESGSGSHGSIGSKFGEIVHNAVKVGSTGFANLFGSGASRGTNNFRIDNDKSYYSRNDEDNKNKASVSSVSSSTSGSSFDQGFYENEQSSSYADQDSKNKINDFGLNIQTGRQNKQDTLHDQSRLGITGYQSSSGIRNPVFQVSGSLNSNSAHNSAVRSGSNSFTTFQISNVNAFENKFQNSKFGSYTLTSPLYPAFRVIDNRPQQASYPGFKSLPSSFALKSDSFESSQGTNLPTKISNNQHQNNISEKSQPTQSGSRFYNNGVYSGEQLQNTQYNTGNTSELQNTQHSNNDDVSPFTTTSQVQLTSQYVKKPFVSTSKANSLHQPQYSPSTSSNYIPSKGQHVQTTHAVVKPFVSSLNTETNFSQARVESAFDPQNNHNAHYGVGVSSIDISQGPSMPLVSQYIPPSFQQPQYSSLTDSKFGQKTETTDNLSHTSMIWAQNPNVTIQTGSENEKNQSENLYSFSNKNKSKSTQNSLFYKNGLHSGETLQKTQYNIGSTSGLQNTQKSYNIAVNPSIITPQVNITTQYVKNPFVSTSTGNSFQQSQFSPTTSSHNSLNIGKSQSTQSRSSNLNYAPSKGQYVQTTSLGVKPLDSSQNMKVSLSQGTLSHTSLVSRQNPTATLQTVLEHEKNKSGSFYGSSSKDKPSSLTFGGAYNGEISQKNQFNTGSTSGSQKTQNSYIVNVTPSAVIPYGHFTSHHSKKTFESTSTPNSFKQSQFISSTGVQFKPSLEPMRTLSKTSSLLKRNSTGTLQTGSGLENIQSGSSSSLSNNKNPQSIQISSLSYNDGYNDQRTQVSSTPSISSGRVGYSSSQNKGDTKFNSQNQPNAYNVGGTPSTITSDNQPNSQDNFISQDKVQNSFHQSQFSPSTWSHGSQNPGPKGSIAQTSSVFGQNLSGTSLTGTEHDKIWLGSSSTSLNTENLQYTHSSSSFKNGKSKDQFVQRIHFDFRPIVASQSIEFSSLQSQFGNTFGLQTNQNSPNGVGTFSSDTTLVQNDSQYINKNLTGLSLPHGSLLRSQYSSSIGYIRGQNQKIPESLSHTFSVLEQKPIETSQNSRVGSLFSSSNSEKSHSTQSSSFSYNGAHKDQSVQTNQFGVKQNQFSSLFQSPHDPISHNNEEIISSVPLVVHAIPQHSKQPSGLQSTQSSFNQSQFSSSTRFQFGSKPQTAETLFQTSSIFEQKPVIESRFGSQTDDNVGIVSKSTPKLQSNTQDIKSLGLQSTQNSLKQPHLSSSTGFNIGQKASTIGAISKTSLESKQNLTGTSQTGMGEERAGFGLSTSLLNSRKSQFTQSNSTQFGKKPFGSTQNARYSFSKSQIGNTFETHKNPHADIKKPTNNTSSVVINSPKENFTFGSHFIQKSFQQSQYNSPTGSNGQRQISTGTVTQTSSTLVHKPATTTQKTQLGSTFSSLNSTKSKSIKNTYPSSNSKLNDQYVKTIPFTFKPSISSQRTGFIFSQNKFGSSVVSRFSHKPETSGTVSQTFPVPGQTALGSSQMRSDFGKIRYGSSSSLLHREKSQSAQTPHSLSNIVSKGTSQTAGPTVSKTQFSISAGSEYAKNSTGLQSTQDSRQVSAFLQGSQSQRFSGQTHSALVGQKSFGNSQLLQSGLSLVSQSYQKPKSTLRGKSLGTTKSQSPEYKRLNSTQTPFQSLFSLTTRQNSGGSLASSVHSKSLSGTKTGPQNIGSVSTQTVQKQSDILGGTQSTHLSGITRPAKTSISGVQIPISVPEKNSWQSSTFESKAEYFEKNRNPPTFDVKTGYHY